MTEHSICTGKGHCIEVKNLNFSYQGSPVLENVSFAVHCGEYLGIVGPNGGGKTTLLKLLLGLLEPDSGSVEVFGYPPRKLRERFRIGYVPQGISHANPQFPATVDEIVRSGRTPRAGILGRFKQQDKDAVEEAFRLTGTARLRSKLIGDLSGGERQRVFIARALAGQPDILILDEPTVGVDIESKEQFYDFLTKLNKELGLTVIFVTHDTDVIAKEAQTILCINRSLVCHESSKSWRDHDHVSHLYGSKVRHVHHQH